MEKAIEVNLQLLIEGIKAALKGEYIPAEIPRNIAVLADTCAGKLKDITMKCDICGYTSSGNVFVKGHPRCYLHKETK